MKNQSKLYALLKDYYNVYAYCDYSIVVTMNFMDDLDMARLSELCIEFPEYSCCIVKNEEDNRKIAVKFY